VIRQHGVPSTNTTFESRVCTVLDGIRDMLVSKNAVYGDSALNPVRVFSKAGAVEQIRVRIDDKISRLQRGSDAGEDTVLDLIGYLVLLRIAEAMTGPLPEREASNE
jgi:hypothetical protein